MATKKAGGKITGHLALTFEATEALAEGDSIKITGTYTCAKADGTTPFFGTVSVPNVKRDGATGAYPVAAVPGDVTVEARAFYVSTHLSAGALSAGIRVGFNAAGKIAAVGAGVPDAGTLLVTSTAINQPVDVAFG